MKFLIAVGTEGRIDIINRKHECVATFKATLSNVSIIYEFQGELWILKKNGNLQNLRNEKHKLQSSLSGYFKGNEIVLQRNKSLFEVYHASTLTLIASLTLEGKLLCYSDGQLLINSENTYWCPIQPAQFSPIKTKTPLLELKLRDYDTLVFLKKWISFESHLLALAHPPPIPEDSTWFSYFLGAQVFPLSRIEATPVFSAAFMALKGVKITEEQKEFFAQAAEEWEKSRRYMSAAIAREFISDEKKCFEDLRKLKKYDLALFYAKNKNFNEEAKQILLDMTEAKKASGDIIVAAVYLAKAGEMQQAIDLLNENELQKVAHDLIDFVS